MVSGATACGDGAPCEAAGNGVNDGVWPATGDVDAAKIKTTDVIANDHATRDRIANAH
jgi:hypothetical protein